MATGTYEIDEGDEGEFAAVVIVTLLLLYLIFVIFRKSVKIVRHSEVMIIEHFGKYSRTLTPGMHFLIPFVENPRFINWRYLDVKNNNSTAQVVSITTDRIDMREHVIDFGKQHVITKDTVQIEIDALVYFRVTDPRVAVFNVANVPDSVELLTQATLRNIIAHMTLDDTFSSRERINATLMSKIQRDAERWGVLVTRVEIFNILPPPILMKGAMEEQLKAERDRRASVLSADGERESHIIRARGDAAKMILLAEGTRTTSVLRAEGEAKAKTALANAEARAIDALNGALTGTGTRAVDYLTAVEYLKSIAMVTVRRGARCGHAILVPSGTMDNISEFMRFNSGVGAGQHA